MTGTDRPLVSVLMPYYNGREFMREAVQSILNQTYPNIEIVVVNDASPNKEDADYIEWLSREFGFKLIQHRINKGIGQSVADAFEASSGEVLTVLSQDDIYKPEKIEKQINELISKKLDAVYAAGDILRERSGRIEKRKTAKTREIIESGTAAEILKLQNLTCISNQGLLAKRSVFERDIIPIWREYLLDDWPVNIRLFEKYRVGFIEEALWTSRSHAQNTSRDIWKWLGPQIEVIARMSPEHLKAEGIGNRLASMARRMQKHNGNKEEIVRFAFAGLMLTESPDQQKKAKRVLSKLSAKDKKAVTNPKRKLLKTALCPTEQRSAPPRAEGANWKDLGKDIARVVSTYDGKKRLHEIGKVFSCLANSIVLEKEWANNAVKMALASLMLMDNPQDEAHIMDTLRSIPPEYDGELIREKYRLLKVCSRPNLRSFLRREFP